jgi:pimeloyl-ACP methyl ester carboxylesterase
MRTETLYKTAAGQQAIMSAYDAALATYWPAHVTLTVPTRYGETFAVVAGPPDAPPLVLLHGAGSNSAVWAGDAAAYTPYFRVYAVDLIGEPGKSAPARPPWEGPAFAEWLADVLDGLELPRVALVGISQGGWTALKFATAWPERVERLILLAPGGVVKDRPSFLLRAVGWSIFGARGTEKLKRLVLGDTEIPAELDEYLMLIMTEFKPRIGALPIFGDEELARLTMPVLLIGGDRDVIRDETAMAARLKATAPDVQTVILPGVGHTLTETTTYTLPFLGITQAIPQT